MALAVIPGSIRIPERGSEGVARLDFGEGLPYRRRDFMEDES